MRVFSLYHRVHAPSGVARIVAAQRFEFPAQGGQMQRLDQARHRRQTEMLLAQDQIVALARQREEIEAERPGGGTGGHAAVGDTGIDAPSGGQMSGRRGDRKSTSLNSSHGYN